MRQLLRSFDPVLRTGRVREIHATYIEADGPNVPLGALCTVEAHSALGDCTFPAEVVRVGQDSIALAPLEERASTFSGALVVANQRVGDVPVGPAFLGRAVDPLGRSIDRGGEIHADTHYPLGGMAASALDRATPSVVLETGIRTIDGLLTLGRGQRIGIFAASGVGKTSLLAQLARQLTADIIIFCLVGERGSEAELIWNQGLDASARSRSTLVAATSDQSAAMRVRAGFYALSLAEYWRGRGKHVLLLLDSATRLAMAMREIGLAAGEPPTVRAYTPGVFATIPKIVERCGILKSGGAISAILTVLSENDEVDDPICELMKSLLDGHIVLSRTLAEQGHFPAIDVSRSISRSADAVAPTEQRHHARQVLEWISLYEASRTLLDAGLYVKGGNPRLDTAIEHRDGVVQFLKQGSHERSRLDLTGSQLARLVDGAL